MEKMCDLKGKKKRKRERERERERETALDNAENSGSKRKRASRQEGQTMRAWRYCASSSSDRQSYASEANSTTSSKGKPFPAFRGGASQRQACALVRPGHKALSAMRADDASGAIAAIEASRYARAVSAARPSGRPGSPAARSSDFGGAEYGWSGCGADPAESSERFGPLLSCGNSWRLGSAGLRLTSRGRLDDVSSTNAGVGRMSALRALGRRQGRVQLPR